MYEQLREMIAQRLSGAQDCPAKEDVIEEITSDLMEKYNELTAAGVESEEAMRRVQEGIGDLEEVTAYINEVDRRSEENQRSGNTNPFAGIDDLMRTLAKDLSPSINSFVSDLKSAAGHAATAAKDAARDAKGPLHDMAQSVKGTVKNAIKNITVTRERGEFRYDYTVPSEGLTGLDIRTASGDVTFGLSQDDNIYIVELANGELTEEQMAQIQVVDGILQIRQGNKSSVGTLLFSYGMLSSDFEIYLPKRAWNSLSVTTTSGDVELDKEMEIASLHIHSTSGDLELPLVACGSAQIETVSGDVELSGHAQELRLVTVSGDFDFNGSAGRVSLSTTSGDMALRLDNVPDALDVTAVSGDTKLWIPDNDGFSLHYNRVSGDIRSDFDLKTSLNAKNGTAVYLSGGQRTYSMQSVSGDLRIYRR